MMNLTSITISRTSNVAVGCAVGGSIQLLVAKQRIFLLKEEDSLLHRVCAIIMAATAGTALAAGEDKRNRMTQCEQGKQQQHQHHPDTKIHREQQQEDDKDDKVNKLRVCGEWCASASGDTPCRIDTSLVPCAGRYCETTAKLWNMNVLSPRNAQQKIRINNKDNKLSFDGGGGVKIPCEMYMAGTAYPINTKPCDPMCLGPETNPHRYPLPTGLGVFCFPGTCRPGASPLHKQCPNKLIQAGLGILQCPCNWFGSECSDEWIGPIQPQHISKTRIGGGDGGGLDHVAIELDDSKETSRILKNYRPGCALRIHLQQQQEEIFEGVYAVLLATTPDNDNNTRQKLKLEMIVAPPDPSLRWEVRKVAEYLRSSIPNNYNSNKNQPDSKYKLYLNPVISGFYNNRYEYLMDYITDNSNSPKRKKKNSITENNNNNEPPSPKVKDVIICATGAGVTGAISAAEAIMAEATNNDNINVHMYYGVRNVRHVPFADRLERLVVKNSNIHLTIVSSQNEITKKSSSDSIPEAINEAYCRGEAIKRQIILEAYERSGNSRSDTNRSDKKKKLYVQDVLEYVLLHNDEGKAISNYERGKVIRGSSIQNSLFVVCGRLQMMDDVRAITTKTVTTAASDNSNDGGGEEEFRTKQFMEERFFQNV